MTIPAWLSGILAGAFVGQLLAVIVWGIRVDRDMSLLSAKLAEITALLRLYDPTLLRADLNTLTKAHDKLDEKVAAHHELHRDAGKRLDRIEYRLDDPRTIHGGTNPGGGS